MSGEALTIGAEAPDFTLSRDGGGEVALSGIEGPVVVFFYPKASTPGCTLEAKDFSAHLGAFEAEGATVLGISRDSVKRQENFSAKQGLSVPLLSDADGTVCEAYGVWGEKTLYGKKFLGITRTTVLIGSDGRIARIWPKVKVAGHAEEVLAAVRDLGES